MHRFVPQSALCKHNFSIILIQNFKKGQLNGYTAVYLNAKHIFLLIQVRGKITCASNAMMIVCIDKGACWATVSMKLCVSRVW